MLVVFLSFLFCRPPVLSVWFESHPFRRVSPLRQAFDTCKCEINFIFYNLKARISPAHAYASVLRIFLAWPRLPDWHTLLLLVSPDSVFKKRTADCERRNLLASVSLNSFCSFLASNSTVASFVPRCHRRVWLHISTPASPSAQRRGRARG